MSLKIDLDNIVNGKNDATNFAAQLMRIVFKTDPINRAKLRCVFPNLVKTVRHFMDTGEILDLPYDGAEDWRPPLRWDSLVKGAVETAYQELNTTKKPRSREDVDKVLIEAGASTLLSEIFRHHSCFIDKGEKYEIQRPDHIDLIEGPGWMIMLPKE